MNCQHPDQKLSAVYVTNASPVPLKPVTEIERPLAVYGGNFTNFISVQKEADRICGETKQEDQD